MFKEGDKVILNKDLMLEGEFDRWGHQYENRILKVVKNKTYNYLCVYNPVLGGDYHVSSLNCFFELAPEFEYEDVP